MPKTIFSLENLGRVIDFLGLLAAQTATKVDDEIVALMRAIQEDEAIHGWFASIYEGGGGVPRGEAPATVRSAFEHRGFNWSKVQTLLPIVIQLIGMFSK